jgi:hypothetical protein
MSQAFRKKRQEQHNDISLNGELSNVQSFSRNHLRQASETASSLILLAY